MAQYSMATMADSAETGAESSARGPVVANVANITYYGASNDVGVEQGDPSEKVFSIYTAKAEEHDKALMESWSNDMDSILIFVSRHYQFNCTHEILNL
jgi:hypothetical protein